ncbi:hypothetical protein ABT354_17785 [Streptomyces sp. NPDC000594]|uniref:hypothetical protein n=1 Tax=Streptomyces sp. NPDC000594 TaxID=3154261 RepID=UPI00331B16FD
MRHRMRIHRVRLGADTYRVVRPDRPAAGAHLHEREVAELYADGEAAHQLAVAWALAARSPRSLIHLPMRGNAAPPGLPLAPGESAEPLDLVLVHHRLGFPPSRWKAVRARLGAGVPHTVRLPPGDLPPTDAEPEPRLYDREFRDHLGFARAAGTVFVIGSATAFRRTGAAIRELTTAERTPGADGPVHLCAELDAAPHRLRRTRRGETTTLHIQYHDAWRAA